MRMTREELKKIPVYARQIGRHQERLRYLRAKAETVPAIVPKERVQTSVVDHSNMEADAAMDLEIEIRAEVLKLRHMTEAAAECFRSPELTPEERDVLTNRYIYCMPWNDIAAYMNYSPRSVYRRHCQALDKLFPDPES